MVVYQSTLTLLVALAVFSVWRVILWRRGRRDPVREVGVWLFFAWVLLVVHITFFPMVIIFYDWTSGLNLVPLASIRQLLTEAIPQVAFRNIVGNVLLFVPFGVMLPLLFSNVRTVGGVAWRAAVISAGIEVLQWVTGARATDVDDIILNTVGAVIGYGIYRLVSAMVRRWTDGSLLDRLAVESPREPLALSLVPLGWTLLITVPFLVVPIVRETISDGESGILAEAKAQLPGSEVLARDDFEQHTFVLVGTDEETTMVGFERVVPGRFTWVSTSDPLPGLDSNYSWTITPFNVARGEQPYLVLWGRNESGARTVELEGFGEPQDLTIGDGIFIVSIPADPEAMGEPGFTFRAADGTDLSDDFAGP
jgi:glycopeptide antibiotics resistance protein